MSEYEWFALRREIPQFKVHLAMAIPFCIAGEPLAAIWAVAELSEAMLRLKCLFLAAKNMNPSLFIVDATYQNYCVSTETPYQWKKPNLSMSMLQEDTGQRFPLGRSTSW